MTKRISLFLPTYNGEFSVGQVIESIPAAILKQLQHVYVFDNQSSDNTLVVIEKVLNKLSTEERQKFQVFQNEKNQLLGGSTQLAFDQAINDQNDYLICMHSDGQANPQDLTMFLSILNQEDYDFVLGSRLLNGSNTKNYSRSRYWANLFFAYLQQAILGARVYDIGAFIAFNLKTLKTIDYKSVPPDMGYHPYLILTASKLIPRKLRFKEFPIQWGKVESSNINVFTYGLKHLARILLLMGNQLPNHPKTPMETKRFF